QARNHPVDLLPGEVALLHFLLELAIDFLELVAGGGDPALGLGPTDRLAVPLALGLDLEEALDRLEAARRRLGVLGAGLIVLVEVVGDVADPRLAGDDAVAQGEKLLDPDRGVEDDLEDLVLALLDALG